MLLVFGFSGNNASHPESNSFLTTHKLWFSSYDILVDYYVLNSELFKLLNKTMEDAEGTSAVRKPCQWEVSGYIKPEIT